MQTALGYGRKSVVRYERDTISVDRQRAAIERLASERNEQIIWYEDAEGHRSGRSEQARPGFGRLLSKLQNDPTVASVIVYELDRAARSVSTIDKLIKLCQSRNVTFISIRDGIDTSRGMGANETFRIHMQASAAEWFANITSDKMKATAADYRERLHIPWACGRSDSIGSGTAKDQCSGQPKRIQILSGCCFPDMPLGIAMTLLQLRSTTDSSVTWIVYVCQSVGRARAFAQWSATSYSTPGT